jgi:uncharacterized protein (DUF4415 family)
MQAKSKSGRMFRLPTPEENAAINAGIAADPDTYELNDAEFARLKRMPGQRGKQKMPTKIQVSMRISPEVVNYFKSQGQGWQTRVDEALKAYIAEHA